jgi:hypothetical protein
MSSTSTPLEHVHQPRSSIALGKRRVNDSTGHDVETLPKPKSADNTSDLSKHIAGKTPTFRYSPLLLPNIRLVSISPSIHDGKLEISLDEAPLTDQLEFHVLSYVWGDPTNTRSIIVNDQVLDINYNLYNFLETMRKHESSLMLHHQHPNYLKSYTSGVADAEAIPAGSKSFNSATMPVRWWIDAICIDQLNVREKNEQVPRMGDIYSMAGRVWIWMGLPSDIFGSDPEYAELKQALAFHTQDSIKWLNAQESKRKSPTPIIEQFADHQCQLIVKRSVARMQNMGYSFEPGPAMDVVYQRYTQVASQTPPDVRYRFFNHFLRQLGDILNQPYFERTWIIQEYVLNPKSPMALIGSFVFDLDHITNLSERLCHEWHGMDQYVRAHTSSVVVHRIGNLMTLALVRQRWHNLPHEGFVPSVIAEETRRDLSHAKGTFCRLPPGEKLDYLLHIFFTRQCTNPLDYFYGLLGMVDYRELPKSLLPDYNLSFEQVSQEYTRYIIESTGDLKIIESTIGHKSIDCPSWVPNVKYLTARKRDLITVSDSNKEFSFSNDGRCLTLHGAPIGEIISCSCTACPTECTDKHLEYVEEVLLEASAEITGKSVNEVFRSWIKAQMDVRHMLPAYFARMNSMQELLERYRDVCRDIPLDAQEAFNYLRIPDMNAIFNAPCRDPEFLYAFLSLARMRYCLLSTGDILICGLKDTNTTATSPSHRWDDCAWALKGLHQLAILRPKDDAYEYCGPVTSGLVLRKRPEGGGERQEFDLDDEFFATREVQEVTLV